MGTLTALSVKAATTKGRYGDGDGLALIVKSATRRSWMLRMQVDGKRRDIGLGSAAKVSLAQARTAAGEKRKAFEEGEAVTKQELKEEAKEVAAQLETIPTFKEAAYKVLAENEAGWTNNGHHYQWITSLKKYAFPFIGDSPINEIDGPAIRKLLLKIWLTKQETARRVQQRVGVILDWGYAEGFRKYVSPTKAIGKSLPKQTKRTEHFASMPYMEVGAFLEQVRSEENLGGMALRFLVLTAGRSAEIREATWSEIDLEAALWTIPAARMKAKREHTVPLSKPALEILEHMRASQIDKPSTLIFPGVHKGRPLGAPTLTKLIRDAGRTGTVHGFRSSLRDWTAEQTDTPGEIVESALAHINPNRTEAAYRRTNYLEKRVILMATWAEYLERCATVFREGE